MPINFRNPGTGILREPVYYTGTPQFDVRSYGGIATPTETLATIRAASAAWAAQSGGRLNFPYGIYSVAPNDGLPVIRLPLPSAITASHIYGQWEIRGYGSVILSSSNSTTFIGETTIPADVSTAQSGYTKRKFDVENLVFGGTGHANQVGVQCVGSYQFAMRHVYPIFLGTGFDLIFCLQPTLISCESNSNSQYGLRMRSAVGTIAGATHSNSAGNSPHVIDYRDVGLANMLAQVDIVGIGGVVFDNLIMEGGEPVRCFQFDSGGSTTSRALTIRDVHHETNASATTQTIFYFTGGSYGGQIELANVQIGTSHPGLVVDASGLTSGNSMMTLRNFNTLPVNASPHWKTASATNPSWRFIDVGTFGYKILEASRWDGGTVPTYARIQRAGVGSDDMVAGGEFIGSGIDLRLDSPIVRMGSSTASSQIAVGDAGDRVGFYGAATVTKRSVAATATDPATTQTLANSVRQVLIDLGLAS